MSTWVPTSMSPNRNGVSGDQQPYAEREGAGCERCRTEPEHRDEAVGPSAVAPGGGGEETTRHQRRRERYPEPADPSDHAGHRGGIGQELADQPQGDQNTGVGVPGAGEGLLEGGHGNATIDDLGHEPTTELDGHERQ